MSARRFGGRARWAAVGPLLALTLPASAAADRITETGAFRSKKDRWLDAKREADASESEEDEAEALARWHAHLDRRIGKKPKPVINIFNLWTHEYLVIDARPGKDAGPAIPEEKGDRFLRCHFTNEPADMDPRLFQVLADAARRFKADRVHIISGFRAPKYNLMLRKKGREVARKSQHTMGKAVDFRIPGVPIRRLHRWARRLKLGGVGFYPSSKFIHVDTADVRYWSGR